MGMAQLSSEEMLSQAFDQISHDDFHDIRAGLLSIDTYLATLCAKPICHGPEDQNPLTAKVPYPAGPKVEKFRKLQDGFQYNIATHLSACLDHLLTHPPTHLRDSLLGSCLDCLQGSLLLHPESRNLFVRESHMMIFLAMLQKCQSAKLQVATIDTMVCALLEYPANMRTFEALNGLQIIAFLFKNSKIPEPVKLRITEFVYFYLLPETEESQTGYSSAQIMESQLKGPSVTPRCRTIKQKQRLLSHYLKGTEGIVLDITRNPWLFDTNLVPAEKKNSSAK
ncbi:hypothetical protein ABW20_dc0100461 [Dactylellina cionopaga]|nr:hypothetical protein ABW20_dc0100461 [Dactylellina cionopaga]